MSIKLKRATSQELLLWGLKLSCMKYKNNVHLKANLCPIYWIRCTEDTLGYTSQSGGWVGIGPSGNLRWSGLKNSCHWKHLKRLIGGTVRVLRIGRGGTCAHAVISKQSFDGSHRSEDLLKRMFRILEARHPDLFLASQSSSPSPHLETARSITCILNHLAGETILECLWHDIWLAVSSQKTQ